MIPRKFQQILSRKVAMYINGIIYVSNESVLSLYFSHQVPKNTIQNEKPTYRVVIQTNMLKLLLHDFEIYIGTHGGQ